MSFTEFFFGPHFHDELLLVHEGSILHTSASPIEPEQW